MKAWIVVESMFGNSRAVADLIAEGLSSYVLVDVFNVGHAPLVLPDDLDLLVVGGPTHVLGMSRPNTRKDAVAKGSTAQPETGLREWLELVSGARPDLAASAFDTRVPSPIPGSAAKAASRRLHKLGFNVIAKPETFYVEGVSGPLRPGERTRARVHGVRLALAVQHGNTPSTEAPREAHDATGGGVRR